MKGREAGSISMCSCLWVEEPSFAPSPYFQSGAGERVVTTGSFCLNGRRDALILSKFSDRDKTKGLTAGAVSSFEEVAFVLERRTCVMICCCLD